tara:strand:+ start:4908 stop:5585 length:678 start_codon:yes stop_codon:yes gene_type:complete
MSEQLEPKSYSQEEMEAAVKARLDKKDQQIDQKEQERQAALQEAEQLRQQVAQHQQAPAQPIQQQEAPAQQPASAGLTQEDVNQQIQSHMAMQKQEEDSANQQKEMEGVINKGMNEDDEFKQLASSNESNQLPGDYTRALISSMGEDALPVIKKALQDKDTHAAMLSYSDPAKLVAWAYRQKGKLVKPHEDGDKFSPKPNVASAGNGVSDFDDDDLSSYIGNMSV